MSSSLPMDWTNHSVTTADWSSSSSWIEPLSSAVAAAAGRRPPRDLFGDIFSSDMINLTGNENRTEEDDSMLTYTIAETIVIATVAGLLSMVTTIGNLMVMISFKMDRQLQTISNYFLLSLAVADFAIGSISMPLYTVYILFGYWPLGWLICDTWLSLDYLASNASVLNLLIISFDRYFSVTRPLTYRVRRTTRKAVMMISSAWLISLILWPPWIFSWPYIEGQRTVPDDKCYIQFLETNMVLTFGTIIAAFYVPVTIMIILYFKVWRETEQRQKDLSNLQAGKKESSKRSTSSDDVVAADEWRRGRSDSTLPDEVETTYVPTAACGRYVPASRRRRRRRWWVACLTFCTIDRDLPEEVDESTDHDGATTPASLETPIQSSDTFIHTISSTVSRDQLVGNGARANKKYNSHPRSQSADSVYTILIKLPPDPPDGKMAPPASIKMIADPETTEIPRNYSTPPPPPPPLARRELVRRSASHGADGGCPIHSHHAPPPSTQPQLLQQEPSFIMTGPSGAAAATSPTGGRRVSHAQEAMKIPLNAKLVPRPQQPPQPQIPKKKKKKIQERKQDRKAAKTLSAILLVFIITWTPYSILVLIRTLAYCDECIPEAWWNFFYYLCYINSTINPLCYALCNATFRRTYVRILRCKWHTYPRQAVNRGNYN